MSSFPTIGGVTRLRPEIDAIIAPDARIEQIAQGYDWSEGPVWVRRGGFLLFSDVPQNVIYRWDEANGAAEFLRPSGLPNPDPALIREGGSIPIVSQFRDILGVETLLLGLALADCRAHSPNENFPLENFEAGIKMNKAILQEMGRAGQ